MPNNEMDYSLIHRTPDGNGKILVTTPGSPDKGSWETEAELKTYVNQDVNIAISALNTRVTNIEETLMGENEITVSYPNDGNYPSLMPNKVPLRALKFAEVVNLRGVSRVANQLLPAIASGNGYGGLNYQTNISFNNGVMTLTGDNIVDVKNSNQEFISGHVYLVGVSFNQVTAGITIGTTSNYSAIYSSSSDPTGAWVTKAFIYTATNASRLYFVGRTGIQIKDYILRDLTLYFGGTIPSDASTIAQIQQNYPHLLTPSEYGTRIVDSSYSGVRAYSANILEPMTQTTPNGTYSDGTYTNNTRLGDSAWAGKIDVSDIGQVTIAYDSCNGEFRYGLSNNDVSGSGNIVAECGTNIGSASVTVNTSGFKFLYMYFRAYTNGTTATLAKVRVNVGDTALAYSAYHAPDTLSLSEPVTLRSAGSVAEEYYPETGRVTHPLAEVDFSTLSWVTDANRARTSSLGSVIKKPADPDSLGNYLTEKGYTQVPSRTSLSQEGQYAVLSDIGQIIFYYNGILPSGLFRYELATPNPSTNIGATFDPFIEVDGGGTIETIQTQTPTLDNCLDVTYDIIPQ